MIALGCPLNPGTKKDPGPEGRWSGHQDPVTSQGQNTGETGKERPDSGERKWGGGTWTPSQEGEGSLILAKRCPGLTGQGHPSSPN